MFVIADHLGNEATYHPWSMVISVITVSLQRHTEHFKYFCVGNDLFVYVKKYEWCKADHPQVPEPFSAKFTQC